MLNRIIAIHKSEIIRSGLSGIIKKLFSRDVIQLTSVDELSSYKKFINMRLIFLVDANLDGDHLIRKIDFFRKSNSVKIIFIQDNSNASDCNENCDCCLPIYATSERVYALLNPCLQQNKSSATKKSSSGLTERETDVVKRVALGKTNKEIAEELYISIHTVISHRKNITEKLGIKSISGLTVYAILNNLIDTTTIDPESLL